MTGALRSSSLDCIRARDMARSCLIPGCSCCCCCCWRPGGGGGGCGGLTLSLSACAFIFFFLPLDGDNDASTSKTAELAWLDMTDIGAGGGMHIGAGGGMHMGGGGGAGGAGTELCSGMSSHSTSRAAGAGDTRIICGTEREVRANCADGLLEADARA